MTQSIKLTMHEMRMISLFQKITKVTPRNFLENVLNPKLINEVKMGSRPDGSKQAIVLVNPSDKGLVVGRAGRNAEKARLLAKRYFGITSVLINSPEAEKLEM